MTSYKDFRKYFDVDFYKSKYTDLHVICKTDNDFINHYKKYGMKEGREANNNKKNIIFSKLLGGIGNQFFMVLNTLSLCERYDMIPVFEYDDNYKKYYKTQGFKLFDNLSFQKYNVNTLTKYKEKEFKFNKIELNASKDYFMDGYFQSYKYFYDYKDIIKYYINLDKDLINKIRELYKSFNKKILSIHIRLGDYQDLKDFHPIPPKEYYQKALSCFNLKDYQIILFSDTILTAKKIFEELNVEFITADDYFKIDEEQLYMMMLSDSKICANSSFSLMSCYLNEIFQFNSGDYIFPKKWFGPEGPKYDICDIIPDYDPKFKLLNVCKNEDKKISILIPTHDINKKQIDFFKKNLPIIFNQTYKNFEIVITDNNDKSDTKDFIFNNFKEYYLNSNSSEFNKNMFDINKFKYSYCKTKGWSPNHNNGLDLCTGELIKILHQDNYFLNNFSLENIVYEFCNNDIKWLVTPYYHVYENDSSKKLQKKHNPLYTDEIVNGTNLIGDPSCLTIKREYILKFNNSMKYLVDCDYFFRLKQKYGLPFIYDIPNLVVLQHDQQVTHTLTINKVLEEHIKLKKIGNNYGVNYTKYPWWVNNNIFSSNSKKIFDNYIKKHSIK